MDKAQITIQPTIVIGEVDTGQMVMHGRVVKSLKSPTEYMWRAHSVDVLGGTLIFVPHVAAKDIV